MPRSKFISYLGAAGAILFIITTIIGGYVFKGYNHISQYISESYANGTEYGFFLRWFGYIPSGFLMGVFCFAFSKHFRNDRFIYFGILGFGVFYGIFTSLVSIFPCDFGCNRDNSKFSISQSIHTVLSILTYIITPLSLYLTGVGLKELGNLKMFSFVTIVLSIVGFFLGITFFLNSNSSFAGLFQRLTEAVYLLWLISLSIITVKNRLFVDSAFKT